MAIATTLLTNFFIGQGDIPMLKVVLTAENYTLGTGINIVMPADVHLRSAAGIPWTDFAAEMFAFPLTNGTTPVATRTTTPGTINLRLWNGATEQATGAVTLSFMLGLVPIILPV